MTSLWKLILCPMMKPVIIKLGDKFKTFLEYFLHKTQKTNSNLFFCMKLKHVRERERYGSDVYGPDSPEALHRSWEIITFISRKLRTKISSKKPKKL